MNNQEELKLLIHKRGQVKAKLTRIHNTLVATKENNERPSLPQLRVHAKNLAMIYQEYNDNHDTVIASVPEDNIKNQEEKYVEFESLYNATSIMVETMIESIEQASRVNPSLHMAPTSSVVTQMANQPVILQQQSFRAPLPTFDGRYEAWPRFKAMFQDLMRHSTDSDAVKLYHLENSLKGDAAGVIDLETLQNNNYQRAWDILEEQFAFSLRCLRR